MTDRSAIVTVLACKTDPQAKLRCTQDLSTGSQINIKHDSAERAPESVKRTGHSIGNATNWASYLISNKYC